MAKPKKPNSDATPAPAIAAPDAPPSIGPMVGAAHERATKSAGRVPGRGEWLVSPFARHAQTIDTYGAGSFNGDTGLTAGEIMPALFHFADGARTGDLALASHTLAVQAITLDTIFTEYARRAAIYTGHQPEAMERYMRLALKAQAQSRATLETLAKLHQPREQTVRHIHVNEGGQAVIADQFHHHAGGASNARSIEQSHAQGSHGPALPSPDPLGQGVPITGHQGEAALQDARRYESGGA